MSPASASPSQSPSSSNGALWSPMPKKKTYERNWILGHDAFEGRMAHHDGIRALWETKWRFPCTKSVYPFHDGVYEDFAPIFEYLIQHDINDGTSTAYTEAFLPVAQTLENRGDEALAASDPTTANELYLRACAVLRIARFPYLTAYPYINCPTKWRAWEAQKRIYAKAGKLWECPLEEVNIAHRFAKAGDRGVIPVYVRVPACARGGAEKVPVIILMTGLDGYRPDNTVRCNEFLSRNWASVVLEIPGTADCPADSADPESPDRLWDSLLEWMEADGRFDLGRVAVWGLSSGGYYAARIAHTHADKLVGSVPQGMGCHYFFDREWLEKVDGHEYPFQLSPAMAMKYGYDSVEEYKSGVQRKFSLLETGILDMPSCPILLINGVQDGLMPIEDSWLLFEHGTPKEGRFFPGALHMGYPKANGSVYPWLESIMERRK